MNDTATGYGWFSIALHWLTAVLILYLLFLGSSIGSLEGTERVMGVRRHTSVAMLSYLLLLVRVLWRFWLGHPGPTREQAGWAFTLGKYTHYAMLVALTIMLISGPLMQLSYGRAIEVFGWFSIPPPGDGAFALASLLHKVHAGSALFLFLAVVLHIGGVYKHTAFNQDGTLAKIIFPGRQSGPTVAAPLPEGEEGEA